jgi:hypothetical protein
MTILSQLGGATDNLGNPKSVVLTNNVGPSLSSRRSISSYMWGEDDDAVNCSHLC